MSLHKHMLHQSATESAINNRRNKFSSHWQLENGLRYRDHLAPEETISPWTLLVLYCRRINS